MKVTLRLIEIESESSIEPAMLRAFLNLPGPDPDTAPMALPRLHQERIVAAPNPLRPVSRPARRPLNGTRLKHAPQEAPAPARAANGETQNALLQLLAKGPLTSAELIAKSKLTPPSVYSALSNLREAGRIETRDDEGTRKNFLV